VSKWFSYHNSSTTLSLVENFIVLILYDFIVHVSFVSGPGDLVCQVQWQQVLFKGPHTWSRCKRPIWWCYPSGWAQCCLEIHSNLFVPFWSYLVPKNTTLKLACLEIPVLQSNFGVSTSIELGLTNCWTAATGRKGQIYRAMGPPCWQSIENTIYIVFYSVKNKGQFFDLTCHHSMKSKQLVSSGPCLKWAWGACFFFAPIAEAMPFTLSSKQHRSLYAIRCGISKRDPRHDSNLISFVMKRVNDFGSLPFECPCASNSILLG
jgi:hypothetical protein